MLYFGCWSFVGHYYYDKNGRALNPYLVDCGPWGYSIDGRFGYHRGEEGTKILISLDGWTALDITDRSVDTRPGSHSVFLTEGILTEEEMIVMAKAAFPHIAARIKL